MSTIESLQTKQEAAWIAECLLEALEERDKAGLCWGKQRASILEQQGSRADPHTCEMVELLGVVAGDLDTAVPEGEPRRGYHAHRTLLRHLAHEPSPPFDRP